MKLGVLFFGTVLFISLNAIQASFASDNLSTAFASQGGEWVAAISDSDEMSLLSVPVQLNPDTIYQELQSVPDLETKDADIAYDGWNQVEYVVYKNGIPDHGQFMAIYRNGILLEAFPVSTGARGHETPTGTYSIFRIHTNYSSKTYSGAIMDYAQFFNGGIAFHATDTRNLRILGKKASKGCIRLARDHARELFIMTLHMGRKNIEVRIVNNFKPKSPSLKAAVVAYLESHQQWQEEVRLDRDLMFTQTRDYDRATNWQRTKNGYVLHPDWHSDFYLF